MSTTTEQSNDFGANVWYIQELYQDYVKDPQSVPEKWRDFLADYHPTAGNGAVETSAAPTPAAPPAPAPAPVATPAPAAAAPAPVAAPAPAAAPSPPAAPGDERTPLKGASARVVA
ncbi:MAG: 2-oxoglutarate dehydrogenase, subunit, partial [Frankiales bacterium]|nr:2-oxoglutarate dehydrogenase, subunit [Frankiales bacterium]